MSPGDSQAVHHPVLGEEVLGYLEPQPGVSVLVDANLGEGGHAELFLSRFPEVIVLGVEVDREISGVAVKRLAGFGKRFRHFSMWNDAFFEGYAEWGFAPPDRILFDLGVSAFHFEKGGRGFSFLRDEPLDMRLDHTQEITAKDIVNSRSEREIADILFQYGEERYARRIASAIVRERRSQRIESSHALAQLIQRAVPPSYRHGRLHPATRSFQALRIAVNEELRRLERALDCAFRVLKEDGRMAVISFHSLEDRIVKRFFAAKSRPCTCPPEWPVCRCGGGRELSLLTKKPVTAGAVERERNPASRSAKLRAVAKAPGGAE
jgi:16S rRNA (cytosine1402-N4)-methyltransferase